MFLKLSIKRFDPTNKSYKRSAFEVPFREGMTILDALEHIKEKIDPSLSFRKFCKAGICGTCSIMINGFPKLACKEQAYKYILEETYIEIEPLRNFEPIKDLVVNIEKEIEKLKDLKAYIEKNIENDILIEQDRSERIENAADCILCFSCQSYCPEIKDENYAGPLYFAKIYRYLEDPRDKNKSFRIEKALEHKLFHCLSCNRCNVVCPKEVKPASLIRELMFFEKL